MQYINVRTNKLVERPTALNQFIVELVHVACASRFVSQTWPRAISSDIRSALEHFIASHNTVKLVNLSAKTTADEILRLSPAESQSNDVKTIELTKSLFRHLRARQEVVCVNAIKDCTALSSYSNQKHLANTVDPELLVGLQILVGGNSYELRGTLVYIAHIRARS